MKSLGEPRLAADRAGTARKGCCLGSAENRDCRVSADKFDVSFWVLRENGHENVCCVLICVYVVGSLWRPAAAALLLCTHEAGRSPTRVPRSPGPIHFHCGRAFATPKL